MKKIFFVVTVASLLSSCSNAPATKEDQAKEKIDQYVKENFEDAASYEEIIYSLLAEVTGIDPDKYSEYFADSLSLTTDSAFAYALNDVDAIKKFQEKKESVKAKEKEIQSLPSSLLGYYMIHKAGYKTKAGIPAIKTRYFYFDTAMNIKTFLFEHENRKVHYIDIFRKNAHYKLKR